MEGNIVCDIVRPASAVIYVRRATKHSHTVYMVMSILSDVTCTYESWLPEGKHWQHCLYLYSLLRKIFRQYLNVYGVRGGALGWGYKPESRRFDSRWGYWNFLNDLIPPISGFSRDSLGFFYRNEIVWGKGGRCVGLITSPPLWADCLEILEASGSWEPNRVCTMPLPYNNTLSSSFIKYYKKIQLLPQICVTTSSITL